MLAAAAVAPAVNRRIWAGPEAATPDDDTMFTAFAPGGPYAFWCNGPVGWAMSKLMPVIEQRTYSTVADMLDLRPDDELLDVGCGPGAFMAAKARHVRRVVGLDASPLMLREAERRLADRIADGTARLVLGNAAALPFGDGEFSAVTAIYTVLKPAEAYRVLRPGGRLAFADPNPERTPGERPASGGPRLWGEADYRRMLEDAGFTDLAVRFGPGGLFVGCRKPTASTPSAAVDLGNQPELTGTAARG